LDHEHATTRFYDLVWPHRASVLRLAQILTGNAAEADDLAQETFIKAFKALGQFQDGTDVLAWLATILRRTRIDRLRAAAASARFVSLNQLEADIADDGCEQPQWQNPQEVLSAFGDQEIIEALQKLPEEIRWTLLLVDVQGMEQQDAARVLEIPVGTVKSRLHRGRAMLRQALTPLAREMRLLK
jgi:RNA polymerase sigma-70 factor (ECF subfamily)